MLPTLKELKDYLRVETATEDSLITDLLSSALAWTESLIGRPILAEERTFSAQTALMYDGYSTAFLLPIYPIAAQGLVVTDPDGVAVAASNYSLARATGRISAVDDFAFDEGPHVITATVGLSAHPDYATKYEPRVRALVMGLASILYHRRNPGVVSESESGSSVSYGGEGSTYSTGVPTHLQALVNSLRIRRIA